MPDPAPETIVNARGTFEVKLNPLTAYDTSDGSPFMRRSIDKQFSGALDATSIGEMLAAGTATKGSAGYVAMERVTGSLDGRKGSFIFQHSATMNRGVPQLSVTVVPDSGTDQLTGLVGSMQIIIDGGAHSYELEYTLPDAT